MGRQFLTWSRTIHPFAILAFLRPGNDRKVEDELNLARRRLGNKVGLVLTIASLVMGAIRASNVWIGAKRPGNRTQRSATLDTLPVPNGRSAIAQRRGPLQRNVPEASKPDQQGDPYAGRLKMALMHMDSGDWEGALVGLNRLLRMKEDYLPALEARGVAHIGLDRPYRATYDSSTILELSDESAIGHAIRAAAHSRWGEYSEALHESERAIELDDRCALAHAHRGLSLYHLGQPLESALQSATEAVTLDKRAPDTGEICALLQCVNGDRESANATLSSVRKVRPVSPRWLVALAEANALAKSVPAPLQARLTRCLGHCIRMHSRVH